jgi:hypothetical protein
MDQESDRVRVVTFTGVRLSGCRFGCVAGGTARYLQMVRICRVRQIVRDQARHVRAEGFIPSAAIARVTGSFTPSGSDGDLL